MKKKELNLVDVTFHTNLMDKGSNETSQNRRQYRFSLKDTPAVYRLFHNSRLGEKEEIRDRIWMCNFEEKKSNLKDIREKTT
jgi:hypothetical protein